mmetsp:Transcript_119657/g.300817  ORF Transcript_119657/g.300817 Transcript_119657/m.300817 type:complete len:231 (+) Transcript_119657:942-1634(+)
MPLILAAALHLAILSLVRTLRRDPRCCAHGSGSERLASPWLRVLSREVWTRGAARLTRSPILVLLEALGAPGVAAPGAPAILTISRALLRLARCALSQLLALPRRVRDLVADVRTRDALSHALGPIVVLRVALHARILTTLGLQAAHPHSPTRFLIIGALRSIPQALSSLLRDQNFRLHKSSFPRAMASTLMVSVHAAQGCRANKPGTKEPRGHKGHLLAAMMPSWGCQG